jgi:hypothetical protein
MKRSRFTEEQIIGMLREQEAGMKTAAECVVDSFPTGKSDKHRIPPLQTNESLSKQKVSGASPVATARYGAAMSRSYRNESAIFSENNRLTSYRFFANLASNFWE